LEVGFFFKNETLRILLVSLCFGYVNVGSCVSLHRVAAGLSTHANLFRHPERLSHLDARSLLAPSFPFSPLLSSSSIFLAALMFQLQKVALHRLLVAVRDNLRQSTVKSLAKREDDVLWRLVRVVP